MSEANPVQMHPLSVLLISGHGEFETGLFQFDPGMHALPYGVCARSMSGSQNLAVLDSPTKTTNSLFLQM